MSTVDVIVPCYRYGHFLRQCVESVLAQDVVALRVLVIDDASPDDTAEVAAELARADARVTLLRHTANRGHIATYNEGIEWVEADYLLLLSADDYLLPDALPRALQPMEADAAIAFVFGNYLTRDDAGITEQKRVLPGSAACRTLSGLEFMRISGARSIVATATAVVRTELQKRLGGYRPELPHSGDMELWLRLAAHGSVGFVNAYQAVYRQHSANMSLGYYAQRSLLDLQQRKACFDLFFAGPAKNLQDRDALRRELHLKLALDATECASSAFNDGQAEASARLSQLALEVSPSIRQTLAWHKLKAKRLIGAAAWNRLAPAWKRLRAPSRAAGVNPATRLALSAQRLNLRLPAALAAPLRALVGRLAQQEASRRALDGWAGPLIEGRGGPADAAAGPLADPAAAAPSRSPSSSPSRSSSPLRSTSTSTSTTSTHTPAPSRAARPQPVLSCLLATSSLDVGGMDEVVAFLARRLPDHAVRTTVLHASAQPAAFGAPAGRLAQSLLAEGIATVEAGADAGPGWIEALRPDVISAHDPPRWVLDAATRLAIPYVDTLHGMHSLFDTDWSAEARRARQLAAIVSVGELVRRQYLQRNPGFPPQHIVTIPNGVDAERHAPRDPGAARARLGIRDEFLFVSLARYCLQKNSYGLVAAFDDVAAEYPEARLVIAGRPDDPVYLSQLQQLRSRLRHRDRVHLRDHAPDPAELLAAADGFVQDSFFEGWSLASMEALHAGVPVVLSEVSGALEQVGRDGSHGHLVPNPLGDPSQVDWETIRAARYARQFNREALVEAMGSLIRNRIDWRASRQRLASAAAQRFDPEICLRRHTEVLVAAARRAEPGATPAPMHVAVPQRQRSPA